MVSDTLNDCRSKSCTLRTTRDDQTRPFKIMLVRLGRNESLNFCRTVGKSPGLRKGVLACAGEVGIRRLNHPHHYTKFSEPSQHSQKVGCGLR